jgi:hypothetical protein
MDPTTTEVQRIRGAELEPGHRLLGGELLPKDFIPIDVDQVVGHGTGILTVVGGTRLATVGVNEVVEIESEDI